MKVARQFYPIYPEIGNLLLSDFDNVLPPAIRQSLTDELQTAGYEEIKIRQAATDEFKNDFISTKRGNYFRNLIERVSLTHFVELIKIVEPSKRTFYELLRLAPSLPTGHPYHRVSDASKKL